LFTAWTESRALPLAHLIDETLTIDAAYRVQTRNVRRKLRGRLPAGFKAGLTSPASQARFAAGAPVAGVLFEEGALRDAATIRLQDLPGLNIETEVALRVGRRITQRIADAARLREFIDGVAPAIELPNLHYAGAPNAIDIVASNVAAARFMVGEFAPPQRRDPNELTARLVCNDRELNAGRGTDALGDQWEAALWVVNAAIDLGWTLEPGQVLLTGALGKMVPAEPGHCSAHFGQWGTLRFTIER
jgi:2-keto-4-pentenoate hydratase